MSYPTGHGNVPQMVVGTGDAYSTVVVGRESSLLDLTEVRTG